MRRTIFQLLLGGSMLICALFLFGIPREASSQQQDYEKGLGDRILIFKLKPEQREGQGYK